MWLWTGSDIIKHVFNKLNFKMLYDYKNKRNDIYNKYLWLKSKNIDIAFFKCNDINNIKIY